MKMDLTSSLWLCSHSFPYQRDLNWKCAGLLLQACRLRSCLFSILQDQLSCVEEQEPVK